MPDRPSDPPALEAKLQLAELARLAFILTHHFIQLMQMLNPRLHFIVLMLANHKVHALRVKLAQRLAKGLHRLFSQPRPTTSTAPAFG